jgi:hypothetical protein
MSTKGKKREIVTGKVTFTAANESLFIGCTRSLVVTWQRGTGVFGAFHDTLASHDQGFKLRLK